jgi:NadR type nicotinamide-nucleotide adenylyltransferase
MPAIKKIVVIGPESTGKSTLCEQLAQVFQTTWCPEFAREYLMKHGMDYSFVDLLTIAKGQKRQEDACLGEMVQLQRTNKEEHLLFIDTDQWVMKVWSEFVFGKCDQWVLDQIALGTYDLYLLCCTDLPWVKDPLREYPDLENREKLFHIYKDIMINQQTPWVEISGNYDQRLSAAVLAVKELLLNNY